MSPTMRHFVARLGGGTFARAEGGNARLVGARAFGTAKGVSVLTSAHAYSRRGFDDGLRTPRTCPLTSAVAKVWIPTTFSRRSFASVKDSRYDAIVVGAGPAGITCVGNMLERGLRRVLWVDDGFDGGRVNRLYREVPSNTKVKLFAGWGTDLEVFRRIVGGDAAAVRELVGLDPEMGCPLSHAADLCLTLTEGLKGHPNVVVHEGRVEEAVFGGNEGERWTTHLSNSSQPARSPRLILCTGAAPTNPSLPVSIPGIKQMDLDTALSPTRLAAALPSTRTTVAVIGASHSAILVLMNLARLAPSHPGLKVKWLTRHPLRYAEYMDGWILRDNTGLKGEAADFARQHLESHALGRSEVGRTVTMIDYEKGNEVAAFEENLPGCDFVVQAIGYSPHPLPTLRTAKGEGIKPVFDHEKGHFKDGKGEEVGGLFGAGIAWPERVVDPYGNVELAVGFKKFMKFVRRVAPGWD